MAKPKSRTHVARIHVDQHAIRANIRLAEKNQPLRPPVTIQTSKGSEKAHTAVILDDRGQEVARVVYRPDKPLSCGARLWVETVRERIVLDPADP